MGTRREDGSAGDADYGVIGVGYSRYRQPDPRIAARIERALGDARTVLNVGAGAGSYEPADREVTAVEPSATMRAQRPSTRVAAIDATAESLPFSNGTFDAAMATFTVHQWVDLEAGLSELRRVTRGPVVILTADPDAIDRFWLVDYVPEVLAAESRRYPRPARIAELLGGTARTIDVPIPIDCTDGFTEAYYGRPEALLDPGARRANSAWTFVDRDAEDRAVARLGADLASGDWDRAHPGLRQQPEYHGSLRLVVAQPAVKVAVAEDATS